MLVPILALVVAQPIDLTFVRHGETVANATGKYNSRNLNVLSELGEKQVDALTVRLLKEKPFDLILVSPSPRALKTIAPYLRASHRTAVVWPLLYECCTGHRDTSKPTAFRWGASVEVPKDLSSLFVVPAKSRLPVSPTWGPGLAQVQAAVAEFRTRCSGKRVLLVGHSGHGGQFLHALTGKWIRVENAKPISIRQ